MRRSGVFGSPLHTVFKHAVEHSEEVYVTAQRSAKVCVYTRREIRCGINNRPIERWDDRSVEVDARPKQTRRSVEKGINSEPIRDSIRLDEVRPHRNSKRPTLSTFRNRKIQCHLLYKVSLDFTI